MTKFQPGRTARATVVALAMLPSLCLAQGFYAGVDVGRSSAGLDCPAHASCGTSAGAAGVRLGYRFTPRWGVELGLLGVGQLTGALDRGLGPERGQLRVGAALYQGTATWARGPWSLTAKFGLADNIARTEFADYPARNRRGVTAAVGAELSYALSSHWRVSVSDEFRPNVALTDRTRGSVNALTAGLSYGFGP